MKSDLKSRLFSALTLITLLLSGLSLERSRPALALTTLTAGDIALIGFNFDDPDEFAFVLLADVAAGAQIKFTDNGWKSDNSFYPNEGTITWTAGAAYSAGTVIAFAAPASGEFSSAGAFALSSSGDQILAYQGESSAPAFLYALNSEGAGVWQADATSSNTSALPQGLVNGATAVALNEIDNSVYTGITAGSPDELLAAISDSGQWSGSDSDRQTLPTEPFAVGGSADAAPALQSSTPASGATGVAATTDITLTFTEPVTVTGAWALLSCNSSGAHAATASGGPTTFTLDPESDFVAGESCTVTLFAAAISDLDTDDPPDTMVADVSWSFTIAGVAGACDELFFSEYVEGSSVNKALEIANGSTVPVELSAYTVEMYSNGASTPSASATLPGTVAAGDVYVIANPGAAEDILAAADFLNSSVANFNGDDAMVLKHDGVIIDVIGQIGFDPGTQWGSGMTATLDRTLRRLSTVSQGDANGDDTFDPALEWEGFEQDTFDGLGEHVAFCGSDAAPRVASVSPTSGATGVATNANLGITFSEPVTVTGAWVTLTCATSGAHTVQASGGPQIFTLDPDVDFTAPEVCNVTVIAAQVTDQDTDDPPDSMGANYTWSFGVGAVSPAPCSTIPQIQGTGNSSPCLGHRSNIQGCVTGVTATGFYFQDGNGDGDPATSDGIYAYYYSTWANPANLQPGDLVRVNGYVTEYYNTTEFAHRGTDPLAVTKIGACPIPAAVAIQPVTDPLADPMALYERFEGMRVSFSFDGWVIGATKRFISRNAYGDPEIAFVDFSSSVPDYGRIFERDYPGYQGIQYLSGGMNFDLPDVDFGDAIAGTAVTGVLGYQFDKYTLLVDHSPTLTVIDNPDVPFDAPALNPSKAEGDICVLNVENLFDHLNDGAGDWGDWAPGYPTPGTAEGLAEYNAKLDAVASVMVNSMRSCMVVGVSEMEGKQAVYNALAERVGTFDGVHTWSGIYVESGDSRDISQGFLYRDDVTLVSGPTPVSGAPFTGWVSDGVLDFVRVPAAGLFRFHAGEPQQLDLRLYAVHFKSKRASASCTTPDCTDKREKEAADMRDILAQHQGAGEFAIALGDYNDTFGSTPIGILDASADILNLYYDLPERERWSYVFNGESEVLDHLYTTRNLLAASSGWQHAFNPLHINADFPSNERASDHDPLRVRLWLPSDAGDLPVSYGQAWHLQLPGSSLRLGATWTDDDSAGGAVGSDDSSDDGVRFGAFIAGQTHPVTVTVEGTALTGRWLSAWFDWDSDGAFSADERVFDQGVSSGANVLPLAVPSGLAQAVAYRFRLCDSAPMPATDPTGGAGGGEVEDNASPAPNAFYTLEIAIVGQGEVTVVPSQTTYLPGTVVTLTALPADSWYFNAWENGSLDNPRALVITGNTIVTATFTTTPSATAILHIQAQPAQGGTTVPAPGMHTYLAGAVVTLEATPQPGWHFLSWLGPVANPAQAATTVTLDADTTITATFNQAPLADAGTPQQVQVLEQVTLDGSGSSDPDGHTPLSYSWVQTAGPAVSLSQAQSPQPTFIAPALPAMLSFTLVVTDAHGLASAPDTVSVTVQDSPINGLSAANSSPTRLGDTTFFTATAGGSNIATTWDFGDGNVATGARIGHTYAQVGVYTARVTATNSITTVVATTQVTVTNAAPRADAGADQTVLVDESVLLDGRASADPDGHTPLSFGWQQVGGPAVALSDPHAIRPVFTAPAARAVLTFTLVVTDATGLASAPDTVVITVEEEEEPENHVIYLPLVCQQPLAPARQMRSR